MKRTSTRLADGRELIYFDETDDAVRRLDDPRELPPLTTGSQIRYDPVLDEWVGYATHRQDRTFLAAAIEILGSADRSLTTAEITRMAIERGILVTNGKTPQATMGAALYTRRAEVARAAKQMD